MACLSMVQELLSFSEGSEPQQLVLCCAARTTPFTEKSWCYMGIEVRHTDKLLSACMSVLNLQCNVKRSF